MTFASKRRHWLGGLLVFACTAALWGWIAAPWLGGEVTIPYDAKAHFQAQIQFLANALHRGDSPFWTPNIFGGSPQIADPQSLIFSPAFLLALLDSAPSFRTMDIYVLALLLAGGLACAQFGRERGWHPAAQVMSALVFAFGASASWRLQHVGQVQSLACFALALWLLARALRHGSWRSGLAAGAASALMVVSPDQVAFLGAYVFAGYTLWFLLRDPSPALALRRAAPALLAGAAVGLVIVAAPLAMTILFSEVSNRAEIDIVEAGRGSLHPASLLTAFVGDLFGAKDAAVEYWGPSSASWSPGNLTLSQNMGQVYVGALPVLAVVAWLGQMWGQAMAQRGHAAGARPAASTERFLGDEALFLLAAFAFVTIYGLGAYTPVFPLVFGWMPGADLFRRPADATFLFGALLALVSGHALNRILRCDGPVVARRGLWLACAAAFAAFAAGALVAAHIGKTAEASRALQAAAAWLLAALAILALCSLKLPARARSGAGAGALCVALGLFVAADLKLNNGPNESTALPPSRYAVLQVNTDNDTIAYLKTALARSNSGGARRDRVELLGMDFHWPNLGMVHGFDHAFGYNPLHLADFTEATGARDHMGGAADRRFTPMFPSFRSAFADMLGLHYVVSAVPLERVDRALRPGDLTLLARTRDGFIYENPRALPRAMFVDSAAIADFEDLLERGLPAGFDPRRQVLLERLPDGISLSPHSAAETSRAQVSLTRYANTEIVVEIETEKAGFVLLNDVWHKWWSATVNGVETDILKANVLFRAVPVRAGRSTIRFSFEPLDGAISELREKLMGAEPEPLPAMAMVP